MFYKHTRLKGPANEVLTAWLLETDAVIGSSLILAQDDLKRVWTVEAVSDQLMLKAQIDPNVTVSRFQPNEPLREVSTIGTPEAILAKPRKTRGPAKLKALPNGAAASV